MTSNRRRRAFTAGGTGLALALLSFAALPLAGHYLPLPWSVRALAAWTFVVLPLAALTAGIGLARSRGVSKSAAAISAVGLAATAVALWAMLVLVEF